MRAAEARKRLAEDNAALHRHKSWLRMWNAIGTVYATTHNLMLMVETDDRRKRWDAAHQLASAIIGPAISAGLL